MGKAACGIWQTQAVSRGQSLPGKLPSRRDWNAGRIEEIPVRALRLAAPRPAYSVLGSERGQLLPPLGKALDCYFRDCGFSWEDLRVTEHEQRPGIHQHSRTARLHLRKTPVRLSEPSGSLAAQTASPLLSRSKVYLVHPEDIERYRKINVYISPSPSQVLKSTRLITRLHKVI